MRIISGKARGKKLLPPKDKSVRPTTDRIKETIFNIICSKTQIEGASVLDLFCGSGALGIESLSRGAKRVIFADKSADSVRLTRQNLSSSGLEGAVFNADFELALKKLQQDKFDIIFLDPPYFDNLMERSLNLIKKYGILAQDGIVVAEFFGQNDLSLDEKEFIIDKRDFGGVSVAFLTLPEA